MISNSTQPTPLNLSTADSQLVTDTPSQPTKRQRLKHEKLTMEQLTNPSAVSSLVAVGHATVAEYTDATGSDKEARMLGAIIRRTSRWAASVAPKHSLAQFVVEARALSTKRDVRVLLSNMRAAQLRGADIAPPEELEPDLIDEDAAGTNAAATYAISSANPGATIPPIPPGSGVVVADVPMGMDEDVIDNDLWEETGDMLDFHPPAIETQARKTSTNSPIATPNENLNKMNNDLTNKNEAAKIITGTEAAPLGGRDANNNTVSGKSSKANSESDPASATKPLSNSKPSVDKHLSEGCKVTTEGGVIRPENQEIDISESGSKHKLGRYIDLDSDGDDGKTQENQEMDISKDVSKKRRGRYINLDSDDDDGKSGKEAEIASSELDHVSATKPLSNSKPSVDKHLNEDCKVTMEGVLIRPEIQEIDISESGSKHKLGRYIDLDSDGDDGKTQENQEMDISKDVSKKRRGRYIDLDSDDDNSKAGKEIETRSDVKVSVAEEVAVDGNVATNGTENKTKVNSMNEDAAVITCHKV